MCWRSRRAKSPSKPSTLGPGVAVEGTIGYFSYDSGDGVNAKNLEALTAGMGLWLGF